MNRHPPKSTRTAPLVPSTTLFRSIGDPSTFKELAKDNLEVGAHFVGDRIARLRAGSVDHLAPGEGGMAKVDGKTVGAYRAPDGTVHAVSITCPHMGCRSEEHTSELQSLMRNSYAVICLKKKKNTK